MDLSGHIRNTDVVVIYRVLFALTLKKQMYIHIHKCIIRRSGLFLAAYSKSKDLEMEKEFEG